MAKVGDKAPDFALPDEHGKTVRLSETTKDGPVLIVFYPGDFTPVCTKQLCDYRDNMSEFKGLGVRVLGISRDAAAEHAKFVQKYDFPFSLLTDKGNEVAKSFDARSMLMLGGVSRAVFIVNKDGKVVYRHVEPTALSRRSGKELVEAVTALRKAGQL